MDPETKLILKQVAEETAEQVVAKMLTTLGMEASDPLAMQKEMAALREWRTIANDQEFLRDLAHLRKWRMSMDSVKTVSIKTAVGFFVTALLGAIGLGLTTYLNR